MAIADVAPSPDVVEGRRLAMEVLFGESPISGGKEEDMAMQSDDGSGIVGDQTVEEGVVGDACDNSDEGEGEVFHIHVADVFVTYLFRIGIVTYLFRNNGSPYIDQVYKVVPDDKSTWQHLKFENREAFVKFYKDFAH
ncbi:unnamed protein product [Linum tenue]|uniref:Uncharacterized protein n=1 Tax=Linum tenue TaxID=586396 RepID=A0AAV0LHH6_9ROSI|nr:unnamed protein product [Linum tenue]